MVRRNKLKIVLKNQSITFAFNMALDKVLFRPVAIGYENYPHLLELELVMH